ncbi:glypican-5-like isoform X2 [Bombina bombina]|uniref:glypican-5-like isoform X2 n=1 Tax=Bombina bombina TaxID=8345 RepID=UPI00235B2E1B|nr:glypican-5-like isoform X2 [Bombina bombina]
MFRSFLSLFLLLKCVALTPSMRRPSCHEVRAAFQLQQVGRGRLVPEVPVEESDLQICQNKAPTCCTRRMEESYQAAVKQELFHNIQALNFELKFMIVGHMSAFQETFDSVIRVATNHTMALFHSTYLLLAPDVEDPIKELFTDISLYILGEEIPVEGAVSRFFDALFPLVYNRLLNPDMASLSEEYLECLRLTRKDINPFGSYPSAAVTNLSKSLWASRMMNKALSLAVQVINTTEHAGLTKECIRALVRMQYCPHCQGFTLIRPCVGYCLNVMRGCLASLADLEIPWRNFITLLEHLAGQMSGSHDLELALLGIQDMVKEAIQHAESHGSDLTSMVDKVCGKPQESLVRIHTDVTTQVDPKVEMPTPATLLPPGHMRREFINYMKLSRTFYASFAERLCDGDLAVRDGSTCWNGDDVVESYTNMVVSNGVKAQTNNPEVKVRGLNLHIRQTIERLQQFTQMGTEKRIKPERWRFVEGSGGDGTGEDADPSGDCDDEDGCQGSGGTEQIDTKKHSEDSRRGKSSTKVLNLPNPSATKISDSQKNLSGTGSRITISSTMLVALFILRECMSQL